MIYFIREDSPDGYIKIGFTEGDGAPRLKTLQTGNPRTLCIVGTHDGDESVERALHLRFGDLRAVGEWFKSSEDLLKYMSENCEDYSGPVTASCEWRWGRGEQTEIARHLKLPLQVVSDVIKGRKNLSAKRALKFEEASRAVLGELRAIPAKAWLRLESHPALERAPE